MTSKLAPVAAAVSIATAVLLAGLAQGCTKSPSSTDTTTTSSSSMATSSSIAQPGPSSQLMVPASRR